MVTSNIMYLLIYLFLGCLFGFSLGIGIDVGQKAKRGGKIISIVCMLSIWLFVSFIG